MDGVQELPVLGCSLDAAGLEARARPLRHARRPRRGRASGALPSSSSTSTTASTATYSRRRSRSSARAAASSRFDLEGGRLTIGVQRPEQRPALDAIAHVLGV